MSHFEKKTLTIINETAGSPYHGMVYRNYYIAKELIKQGHRVQIISASFFHNFSKLPKTTGFFTHEVIDGIDYWWVKVPKYSQSRSFGRLFSMFIFPVMLLFFPKKKLINPDVIIVSGPPHLSILIGWIWSKLFRSKLIYEVRDIWPLTIQKLAGLSKWNPLIVFFSIIECFAYKVSSRVVSVLAHSYKHFLKKGMNPDKFAYIPNGVSLEESNIFESHTSRKLAILKKNKFIIIYAGAIGIANNLDQFVKTAKLFVEDDRFHFVIVGNGSLKADLMEDSKSLPNISFFDQVLKNEIPGILAQGHIGYLGLKKSDVFSFGISPNKLFDYMAAKLPVIMAIDTDDNIVGKAQCGFIIKSCAPEEIKEKILELYNLGEIRLLELGQNGRKYLEKYHSYKSLALQYNAIFDL